jgi:hypothetical protein
MNSRYQGPAVFPPASETRKRIEAHLDTLPSWEQKPTGRPAPARKKWTSKLRRPRRRP